MPPIFILLSCFIILLSFRSLGQNDSKDYLPFNEDVKARLLDTPNKQFISKSRTLLTDFEHEWNKATILQQRQGQLEELLLLLDENRLRNYPYLYNLLELITEFSIQNQTAASFGNWLDELASQIHAKQPKLLDLFISRTADLFKNHKLGGKGTTAWYFRNGQFSFVKDTALAVKLNSIDLLSKTRMDSLVIHQTEGVMDFHSMQFKGENGRVSWQRFGMDEAARYVDFQTYSIDFTRPQLQVDSALLNMPEYFDRPVLGQFNDQVFHSPPTEKTPYPKFRIYLDEIEIADFFPNIDYIGGLKIEGERIIGASADNQLATLQIKQNGKPKAQVRSKSFTFTETRIQTDQCAISFSLDGDSLYHAGLWMRYDKETAMLNLSRSMQGVGDLPFLDSYHQVNIFVESLYWNVLSDKVEFRSLDGMASESTAVIESLQLFSDIAFDRIQAMDDRHPIYVINDYIHAYQTKGELKLNFLADFMKKPPEQVISLFLRLASLGYLNYDPISKTAYATDRFFHILEAKADRADFDVIALHSLTPRRQNNLVLNLSTNDLEIYGLDEVLLSKAHGVRLFPEEKHIVMKRNRDFSFSGRVRAGLFDFYAREASFEYDPFKLNFNFVDSLAFVVRERTTETDRLFTSYVKVNNVISDLTGTLYVDHPDNKSGSKQISAFPKFQSKSESYVYFDNENIQQGTLNRESFYYVVDPFVIDSLDSFSTDNLRFEGYLNSAGIFPVFREPLTVMQDYSLGFDHKLPKEGYTVYDGLGRYEQSLHLSNQGMLGFGALHHLTSTAYSKEFVFYPDSVVTLAEQFVMKEQAKNPQFPSGKGENIHLQWDVSQPVMMLNTSDTPFEIYGQNDFYGTLLLHTDGLKGSGDISFESAKMQSSYFDFFARSFGADTANFSLYTADGKKEAFLAQGYKALVNYENRKLGFTHLDENSKLSFPFNQYYCTLDEAEWLMDEQRVLLNNQKAANRYKFDAMPLADIIDLDLTESEFVSEHPLQDSLSFFCLRADYDLNNYAIVARDVKIIKVADAAIFPEDGIVSILGEAEMKPLESATIIANVNSKMHRIHRARVQITSKNKYTASGNYTYTDLNNQQFILEMPDIYVSDEGNTIGRADITEEDAFYLNPWFSFYGDAFLDAKNPYMRFKGGVRLMHNCLQDHSFWILFDTLIDPLNVAIPVTEASTDVNGGRISNGLYYATVNDSYYAAFMQRPKGADRAAAFISGDLVYDKINSSYNIRKWENDRPRTLLSLNTTRCIIEGRSEIDLDLKLGQINLESFGEFSYKMIPDSLYLDVFAKFQFSFDDKLMKMMADSLDAANLPGAELNKGNYLSAMRHYLGETDADKIQNEIALYGAPRKLPDQLQNGLVFSDIKLKWNPETRSFVSMGPIGLANVLKSNSNKLIEGFIEIEKSRAGDGFSIHLMPNARQWYFFNYRAGVLQALSSSNEFNTDLMKIKQDKRVINSPTAGRYEFVISSRRKMVDFLRKMQTLDF